MKKTLLVLITIISIALPATGQAAELDIKAIAAKPAAHNPQYDNKELWPTLAGDEYFTKQKWPKARLLIWAHPGENPSRDNPLDPMDPANWIDAATGKPAEALPDMETDVILPDADKPYKVSFKGQKNRACRHLTVGKNAVFEPGGGGSIFVFGNVWIRPGGIFYVYRTLKLTGSSNTFFRNDWPADGKLKKMHDTGIIVPFDHYVPNTRGKGSNPWRAARHSTVCYFFQHDKAGKTTEFIGYIRTMDEVAIKSGTLIVGRDSRFLNGGAAIIYVAKDASIALMDGAMTGKSNNQFRGCLRMQGGSITAGTPDRPIKRDARLGVGYENWMNLSFPSDGPTAKYGRSFSASVSGKLIGYPARGSDARLVFGWQRISAGGGGRGTNEHRFNQVFARLQPKITIWITSDTQVENVRFEDLHRGGIVLPDTAAVEKWKNVTYGNGCLSKDPKELIREYKGEVNRGRTKEALKPEKKYISM